MTNPRLLKISEAAEYLNIHANTVHRLIKEGKIKAVKLGPKSTRIDIRDLEALRNAN